jgi:hypothetical protein
MPGSGPSKTSKAPVRILPPETRAVMPITMELRELFDAVATHWPQDFATVEPSMFTCAFRVIRKAFRIRPTCRC